MIHVHLPPEGYRPGLEGLLRRAARATLDHEKVAASSELSIALSDDALLKELNQAHRGEDHPTDVLSFPGEAANPESGHPYLGDVVISLPRAAAQAKVGGHELEAELQLLVVHGVLHLLGHDHSRAADKRRMWAAQEEILASLDVRIHPEASERATTQK